MLQIAVTGTEALTKRLLEIGQDAPKAASRAINRTLTTIKTATVRALVQKLNLRNKDVAPSISTKKATFTNQIGELDVTGKRIPLIAFGARQTKAGVTYKLPGGRGFIPGAFLAKVRAGGTDFHTGVFFRTRPGERQTLDRRGPQSRTFNLPIIQQFGPSLPHAMVAGGLLEQMLGLGAATLEKNMTHEIDWIIQQRVAAGDE